MGFLEEFMGNNSTLKDRMLTIDSFGQPLDNEANDVPLYDQYNTGLAATQQNMSDRINLSIDPRAQPRCGTNGHNSKRGRGNDARGGATATATRSGHGSAVSGGAGSSNESSTETVGGTESVVDIF